MAEGKTNGQTELVFILDRSGSRTELAFDTIGGSNGMLAQHRGDGGSVKQIPCRDIFLMLK